MAQAYSSFNGAYQQLKSSTAIVKECAVIHAPQVNVMCNNKDRNVCCYRQGYKIGMATTGTTGTDQKQMQPFSTALNELISRCYRVYPKETLETWMPTRAYRDVFTVFSGRYT